MKFIIICVFLASCASKEIFKPQTLYIPENNNRNEIYFPNPKGAWIEIYSKTNFKYLIYTDTIHVLCQGRYQKEGNELKMELFACARSTLIKKYAATAAYRDIATTKNFKLIQEEIKGSFIPSYSYIQFKNYLPTPKYIYYLEDYTIEDILERHSLSFN